MTTPQQMQALLNGPAMLPPPGIKSNFTNPENSLAYYFLSIVLTVTISTLVLFTRMYTKIFILRKVGWEDYTSFLGYLLWIGYCVSTSLLVSHGGGVHQWNVQLKDLISILYLTYVSSVMYYFAVFSIKLSILLLYMKAFASAQFRDSIFWGIHAVIWINFAFYFALLFAETFLCKPREKYWNVFITTGYCLNRNAANIAAGCVNSISDFVIVLLPQKVIWKLQMPLKRKLGVSAIFLTGFFVCVTSVLRLYYTVRLAQTGDVTYHVVRMGFWTYAELSMGIVCGCLPVLPKFFQSMAQKMSITAGFAFASRKLLGESKSRRRSTKWSPDLAVIRGEEAPQTAQAKIRPNYITLEEYEIQNTGCREGV